MGCIHTPNPYSSPCGDCRARDLEDKLTDERKLRGAEAERANKAEAEAETERAHRFSETARADRERTLRLAAERERDEARCALPRSETVDLVRALTARVTELTEERDAAIAQAKHVGSCLVECSARAAKAEADRDAWCKQCNLASEAQAQALSEASALLARAEKAERERDALIATPDRCPDCGVEYQAVSEKLAKAEAELRAEKNARNIELDALIEERDAALAEASAHNAAATQYEKDIERLRAELDEARAERDSAVAQAKLVGSVLVGCTDRAEKAERELSDARAIIEDARTACRAANLIDRPLAYVIGRLYEISTKSMSELERMTAQVEAMERVHARGCREAREAGRIDVLRAVFLGAYVKRTERNLGSYITTMLRWMEGQALRALVEHGQDDAARIVAEREEYEHG